MRRNTTVTVLLLCLAMLAPPVRAASAIHATLDGRAIPAASASHFYCHDFAYPEIRCFGSAARLMTALGEVTDGASEPLAAPAGTWVTVYRDVTYAGTFAYLSHNYDNLSVIGWNDTISSFKVQVSFSGVFAQHSFGAGWQYAWCCFQNIPNVGSAYNDQFSSFYRS